MSSEARVVSLPGQVKEDNLFMPSPRLTSGLLA